MLRPLFALSFLFCLCLSTAFSQSINFRNDVFDSALETGERENKLIFIDTWAEWCGPCKIMEPVFRDRALANYMNANFVNVRIDMGTESDVKKQVARKYNIFFLPTLLILDHTGNLLFRSDNQLLTAEEILNVAQALHTPQDYLTAQAKPQSSSDSRLLHAVPDQSNVKIKITDDLMLAKLDGSETNVLVPMPGINDPDYSDDPNEKVLYTLGQGDEMPPEILYEEAYFRLTQLADGSHHETVVQYLDSQSDWGTNKNVKFVFDFLDNTNSKQFKYMIENRSLFESIIGKEKVAESIGFLVHHKLYKATQLPTPYEAELLFSYIHPVSYKQKAKDYLEERDESLSRD